MKNKTFNISELQGNTMKAGVLLLALLLIPLISAAQSTLGTFKQNECINLLQTCALCTYNNISTVIYPNSTQALGQTAMTKVGTVYNATFCNTSVSGTYIVNGYGDLNGDGINVVWSYTLQVNPVGGAENNTTFFIVLGVISLGLLIFGFVFENYIFAFFSGLAFLITGVYGIIYGYGGLTNLYTRAASAILIGIGMIITVLSGLNLANVGGGSKPDNFSDDF